MKVRTCQNKQHLSCSCAGSYSVCPGEAVMPCDCVGCGQCWQPSGIPFNTCLSYQLLFSRQQVAAACLITWTVTHSVLNPTSRWSDFCRVCWKLDMPLRFLSWVVRLHWMLLRNWQDPTYPLREVPFPDLIYHIKDNLLWLIKARLSPLIRASVIDPCVYTVHKSFSFHRKEHRAPFWCPLVRMEAVGCPGKAENPQRRGSCELTQQQLSSVF